jgi:hypothetical protein
VVGRDERRTVLVALAVIRGRGVCGWMHHAAAFAFARRVRMWTTITRPSRTESPVPRQRRHSIVLPRRFRVPSPLHERHLRIGHQAHRIV